MKTVLVLGSTGSIGKSTLEVLDLHKENFKCIGLSANKNFQALHEQANKYSVKNICIQEDSPSDTDIEKNSDIKKISSKNRYFLFISNFFKLEIFSIFFLKYLLCS